MNWKFSTLLDMKDMKKRTTMYIRVKWRKQSF